ncbi:MAG: T9SS type A sorting domain-containing protein, partial [Cryomorphaceae bacterium]
DDIIIVGDSGLILTNSAPLVDFIEITSEEDLFEIDSENGTLQLSATVFPESAPQNVSWSMVNLSGTATIDQNGLVTAQGNGLVMAVASIPEPPGFTEESETNLLSPTSGTFFILISGQSLGEQYLFGSDTTICGSDILTVNLPGSVAEVEWSDGSTELGFEISEAGTYWVTVTDGDFIRSDSIQVVQFPYPEFSLGEDLVACSGDDVSLEAPIFGNYEWSTGSDESGIVISEAGEYVLGITLNGCTSFDEINVSFLEVPEFDLGEDLSLCEGESTILSAPVEGEYSWSTGSTDAEITVEDEGWIVLEIFDGECSFADSLFLEVKPLPEFSLGADTVICDTASIVLEAFVEGATYQWSDGSDASSIEVAEEGEYSVLVTLNGCSAEDEISVDLIYCTLSTSSEISETTFNIFPNPASDLVTLEIPEKLVGASVSVFTTTGKLIDQLNQNSIREELDVSSWPKGIYLIRIEQAGMAVTKELVLF